MKRAFTLIELLIVVAIIAILAAIAVPNFLEAQTRSKVSKCKSDMRSITTAIESYMVDNNKYPFDRLASGFPWYLTDVISTPIAYMSNVPTDIFTVGSSVERAYGTAAYEFLGKKYRYYNYQSNLAGQGWACCWLPTGKAFSGKNASAGWAEATKADSDDFMEHYGNWKLQSMGPDKKVNDVGNSFVNGNGSLYYDPTNGTMSDGDIILSSKGMK